MAPSKNGRGCWTCKQRKVACDRQRPWCEACRTSRRQCLGYGLKLSWPREGDKKRAIVLQSDARNLYAHVLGELVHVSNTDIELFRDRAPQGNEFVNISMFDVDLYRDLLKAASLAAYFQDHWQEDQIIRRNPRWPAFPSAAMEIDLLAYYQEKVAPRLTSANSAAVQNLIYRMSFTDTEPGSAGVLFAIYAVASLHFADSLTAQKFKSKAVTSILASTRQSPHASLSLQQIVTFALLSMFETAALTHPLIEWAHEICCLRVMSMATFALTRVYEGDEALVLELATYHDFLTQFSTRHNPRRTGVIVKQVRTRHLTVVALNSPRKTLIRPTLACSLEVFCALSSILDTCWDINEGTDVQSEALDRLERRLKYAKQDLDGAYCSGQTVEDIACIAAIAELHRLAGLIYLYRVGRRVASNHPTLQSFISDAFELLQGVRTCERTFPLFLLGCEAESDVQRALILRISRQTEEEYFSTVMVRMREYIERFWALADLDTAGLVGHAEKMTAAVSAQRSFPSFL